MAKSIHEKEIEKKETKETEEEPLKINWTFAVPVKVSSVVLERTMDKKYIKRVRFETDLGNITYKPKIRETETEGLAGYKLETEKNKLLEVATFIADNPMLSQLAKDSTKENPKEIWLSYGEIERFNDLTQETEIYRFLSKSGFTGIYYDGFHQNDELKHKMLKLKEERETDLNLGKN